MKLYNMNFLMPASFAQQNVFESVPCCVLVMFYSKKYSFLCIYHYHSPAYGHLGCFQFLAIVSEASRNICVQIQ